MAYTTEELGRLIARAHYQAWRLDAPPFDLTPEELAAILPNLIRSGSAGIVWHRVKPFREKYGAMAYALEAATDAQIAHNQRVEEAVVECVTRLRAYGIEPVLVKGLALAKLYPEGIVRPAGDIDLVVRKEEFAAAHAILHDRTKPPIPIDLKHPGIWEENPCTDYADRLTTLTVQKTTVKVLGQADSLRMQTFHYWRHLGKRILWVIDFALVADTIPAIWWQELAGDSRFDRERLTVLADVAVNCLGADVARQGSTDQPGWLTEALLYEWAVPEYPNLTLVEIRQRPLSIISILRDRWSAPIQATIHLKAPFDGRSRRPLQILSYLLRMVTFPLRKAPRQFWEARN